MTVTAPFADIEARMAADTMAFLANAVATVVTPVGDAGREFAVIFDAAYLAVMDVESSGPAATALDADVEGFVQGSVVSIRGVQYAIRSIQPDGAGQTVLRLREAS